MNKKLLHPAIVSVWAAVVAAGHLLPAFYILGTGARFSFASALNPLSGIFFGPLGGALCSAIGCFIGTLIAPDTAWMGLGTFLVGMTTAFTAGCITWGKWPPITINSNGSFIINGGIVVYFTGTVLWFTQEIGRSFIFLPIVFYGFGFAVMIIAFIFAKKLFVSNKRFLLFPAIWLCSFGGLVGGAAIGNFFNLVLYKTPRDVWILLMVTSPIERILFALAAAFVGVPLLTGLNKLGIISVPHNDIKDDDTTDIQ